MPRDTQIHTHMCYSEFNDILSSIAAMDSDVITIETSRSRMELLEGFGAFQYPNEIGPGVYDIHAPRVPSVEDMVALLERAAQVIPPERLHLDSTASVHCMESWTRQRCAARVVGTEPVAWRYPKAAYQN